jgi:hypothetical protein
MPVALIRNVATHAFERIADRTDQSVPSKPGLRAQERPQDGPSRPQGC